MHSFTLKGLRHICFPRYFANIPLTAASRIFWKQPSMCVLNSGSSKSCGKSPEIHFYWSPLGSIFKRIPIGIFIGILQLKHCRKRHYLLFCTVYISMLLWQRDRKCWYWVGPSNEKGWVPSWRVSHKHLCENGIRNKKFSLVFTSVVFSQKHGESEESTGKVWENKTFQGQVFLPYFGRSSSPYSSQNSKNENTEFT